MNSVNKPGMSAMPGQPPDLLQTLAHHDAAISTLGGRMTGVETSVRTLQGEVHTGFAGIQSAMNHQMGSLTSKLDRLDARPTFNIHQAVATVLSLSVLFSLVVGGIIWVNNALSTAATSDIKHLTSKIEKQELIIDKLSEKLGWVPRVEPSRKP